jgi:hypothetical protein
MTDPVKVSTGYIPRPLQSELHNSLKRFSVLVCHRRFGKTVFCLNEMIDRALTCKKPNPRFAYIAPLYKQAKSVAWDYLKEYTKDIPGTKFNESELRVDFFNGSRIILLGADNPDAVRGMYLDGAILDEYAQMSPRMWGMVIRPLLSDRKGWAVFIGTPMGHNQFWDIYDFARRQKGWFSCMYKASDTLIIDQEELDDARMEMDDDEYEQEFECSFTAAVKGAYYGKLLAEADHEGRIADVPFDPALPVSTGWDIGIGDDTVIWFFQQSGGWINVIDFYSNRGEGMSHYKQILDKYSSGKNYVYNTHYGPHDLEAKEWGTGKTRQEQASALGLDFEIVPQIRIKDDGHNAVRAILPRCRIDVEKCSEGIEALRQYRREWDDKNRTFRDRPLHDWCSHPADGFQTLALGVQDRYVDQKKKKERYSMKTDSQNSSWMTN